MPLPERRKGEPHGEFQSRCMSDPVMIKDYPDIKQRAAICYKQGGEKPNVGGEHLEGRRVPCDLKMCGEVKIY